MNNASLRPPAPQQLAEVLELERLDNNPGGARGLMRAGMFDRERRPIASVVQDSLIRPIIEV